MTAAFLIFTGAVWGIDGPHPLNLLAIPLYLVGMYLVFRVVDAEA